MTSALMESSIHGSPLRASGKEPPHTRRSLPTVNAIGRMLEPEGLVRFGRKAYNQTEDNCNEIACRLAEMFGYVQIQRKDLAHVITRLKSLSFGWGDPDIITSPRVSIPSRSPACFVIRGPDNPTQVHVTFEYYGREYNYSVGSREGFVIELRIPLHKIPELSQ